MKEIQILQGELFFTNEEYKISTILGSCLAVTFFHPETKASGIFHAFLPSFDPKTSTNPFNYVDYSMNYIINKFIHKTISLLELEIKIFGGSNMFGSDQTKSINSVGQDNINMALKIIKDKNLNILQVDTGGSVGRKIIFNTSTGTVFRKFLNNNI